MLSAAQAARLRPLLDALVDRRPWRERVRFDPVEFGHRFSDPRDVEAVSLIASSLAYGRAQLFKPKVAALLEKLGPRPALRLREIPVKQLASMLDGFVYRFNRPGDVGVLLAGIGACFRRFGSLEEAFLFARRTSASHREALSQFSRVIRESAPAAELVKTLGPARGLDHLLPIGGGAAKRLCLYLRWMVRGPDSIDFGIWKQVDPSSLVVPLDTHVARIGTLLGLTQRKTRDWAMAQEVTDSLLLLNAGDPVRYDFALCHLGMSGACPVQPQPTHCAQCPLQLVCSVGRRFAQGLKMRRRRVSKPAASTL